MVRRHLLPPTRRLPATTTLSSLSPAAASCSVPKCGNNDHVSVYFGTSRPVTDLRLRTLLQRQVEAERNREMMPPPPNPPPAIHKLWRPKKPPSAEKTLLRLVCRDRDNDSHAKNDGQALHELGKI